VLRLMDLASVDPSEWPGLTFRTVPSFSMLDMQWGIEPLWHALNADEGVQTDAPEPSPHSMVVWRQDLQCRWRTVDDQERMALTQLSEGKNFSSLCESLAAVTPDQPEHQAAQLLQRWVQEGILAST